MKKGIIIILGFLVLFYIVCYAFSKGDTNYKQYAKSLVELLNEFEKIQVIEKELQVNEGDYKAVLRKDVDATNKFVEKNRGKWKETTEGLKEVEKEGSKSRWSDDALFCVCIGYSIILNWGAEIDSENPIPTVNKYIQNYQDTKLESWTKKKFGRIFWDKFSKIASAEVSEKNNINALLSLFKGSYYLKQKRYKEAIDGYRSATQFAPESMLEKQAQVQIEMIEKLKNR